MAKNTPRVQICTRVQIAHMNEALGDVPYILLFLLVCCVGVDINVAKSKGADQAAWMCSWSPPLLFTLAKARDWAKLF